MKVVQILVLIFFCQSLAQAQQNEIDSLRRLLPSLRDTTRVRALNKLAFKVMFSAPQKAEQYTKESIEYARQIGFTKGLAHAYQVLGISYDVRSEFDRAIQSYETGIKLLEDAKIMDDALMLALNNVAGVAYYHQGKYIMALDAFLKALQQAEQTKSHNRVPVIQMNIGLVYHDQKEYDRALTYYLKSKKKGEATGNSVLVGRVSNNIGIIYKEREQYEEAIRHFETSLEMKEKTGDQSGISASLTNLGTVYKRLKDYPRALEYLDRAEAIKLSIDDKLGLIIVRDTRAAILIAQKKLPEAEVLIRKNLNMVKDIGGENKILVYERFHDLYTAKRDFEKALYWHKRKTEYNDSLFNQTKSRQLAELQTLYEVSKKEKEIARLEKDKQKEQSAKNLLIISMVSITVIVLSSGYFIWFRVKKKNQLHTMELTLQQELVENARLREAELRHEIDFKNKELASYTMNFVQKSELMEELKRNLQEINPAEPDVRKKIFSLRRLIESSYQVDREWEDFKMQFENVHANFFQVLKEHCPELTNGDMKLCALLKLNMNMKEAAKILGISPESVKTARYRLRKKFELNQDDNLIDFIQNIHNMERKYIPDLV